MRVFTYKVGTIQGEDGKEVKLPMSGTVEIEVPTYKERLTLIKQIGFSEIETDKGLDKCLGLIEIVEKRVRKVEIKIDNGDEIKDLETLGYYKEGAEIINDIGRLIISGFGVGKL